MNTIKAGLASIPLIIGAWMLNDYANHVDAPRTEKLADFTNTVMNVHLKVPKGAGYALDLNIPGVHPAPNGAVNCSYKFSGHIRISEGATLVVDFPIGSDIAWLTGSGFVLTGAGMQNTNVPPLSQFVEAQKEYDFQITLNPQPPPSASISLYWLHRVRDKE